MNLFFNITIITQLNSFQYGFQFRLWRKNRRPVGEHVGIDLNRNWNNNWMGKKMKKNIYYC